jgi:transglutaminase-like putative cysteine protease
MNTATSRLWLALVASAIGGRSSTAADLPRHFEGPYHVSITPLKRVRATVTSTFSVPNLETQEWWAAFPWPPKFEGQTQASARVLIVEAPQAESRRIADEGSLHQPLLALHWFPDHPAAQHSVTAQAIYEVTINRRTLEPGPAAEPAARLTPRQRTAFLASTKHFDFTTPKFQVWLTKMNLRRKMGERDLDFAFRALETVVTTHTYRFELNSIRTASAVAATGWSDCGGLSTLYVSILRAAGIPARCLCGRPLDPTKTHVKLDFYAEDVGWVPADPAVAVGSHRALAGFGREHFDMVITHFDLIRLHGKYHWMQGIGIAESLSGQGSGGGSSFEHTMAVEELPLDRDPKPILAQPRARRPRK